MNKRNDMPKPSVIHDYWFNGEGKSTMEQYGVEVSDQETLSECGTKVLPVLACFACGDHVRIQRCHILPLTDGGSNAKENLHLLCPRCHIESEFLTGEKYWRWLKYQCSNEWKTYTEHTYQRMVKIGYDEKEFLRIYSENGVKASFEYSSSFMPFSSDADRQEYIRQMVEKADNLTVERNREDK